MTAFRRLWKLAAQALAALSLLQGCAAAGRIPPAFEQALGPVLPAPVEGAFPAALLEAPRISQLLLYEGGSDAPPSRVLLDVGLNEARDELRLEQRDAAGALLQLEEYVRAPAGWALARSTTPGRSVLTAYEPPMLQFPDALAPNAAVESSVHVVVHPLQDPSRVQQRGKASNRVELAGRQTVRTGQGQTVLADVVRLTFTGAFGVARVRRVTELWLAPHVGVVALRVRERVTALGAPISALDQALLLDRQLEASPTVSTSR